MIPIVAIIVFIGLYLTTLLSLHSAREHIGYGPLYAFIGTTIAFFNFFSPANIMVTVAPGITYALTSTTLVVGVFATSFLLYLTDGIQRVRKMILAVLLAEIFTFIYPFLGIFFVNLDPVNIQLSNPSLVEIYSSSYIISMASTIAIIFDCLFVVISFQFIVNRLPLPKTRKYSIPTAGAIALIIASIGDAIMFPLMTMLFGYAYQETILTRLPRFFVISIIYALIITFYAHMITKGKFSQYLTSRSTLELLVGKNVVPVEDFLAEKRRAEILFNLMSHDMNNALQINYSALELLKNDNPGLIDSFPVKKLDKVFNRMKKISDTTALIGGLQYISKELVFSEKIDLSFICNDAKKAVEESKPVKAGKIDFINRTDKKLIVNFNPL
ncbi:MAG: hypothetical protein ACFFD4_27325, partial [Candidatus Odinarchaeota archaeon]